MRLTEKSQVTIPKPIRDKLGIGPGSEVEFVEHNGAIVLERRDQPTRPESFADWADGVAGTIDTMDMDGKEFIDWLRGPRDDIDPR